MENLIDYFHTPKIQCGTCCNWRHELRWQFERRRQGNRHLWPFKFRFSFFFSLHFDPSTFNLSPSGLPLALYLPSDIIHHTHTSIMTTTQPDKLSLSFILNPSLSAMEEDTVHEENHLVPPPQSTRTWQSCRRPSFSPPFASPFLYQHNPPESHEYRFTFPLRRESQQHTLALPNIAFFQHNTTINTNYANLPSSQCIVGIPQQEEKVEDVEDMDMMIRGADTYFQNFFFPFLFLFILYLFKEIKQIEDEDDEERRERRAHTAPAVPASAMKQYRFASKFSPDHQHGAMTCTATGTTTTTASKRQPPRKITAEQLSYLEKAFEEDRMPDTNTKMRISQELNLSPQQVKIW